MKHATTLKVLDSDVEVWTDEDIPEGVFAMVANSPDVRKMEARPEFVVGHLQKGVIQCECGHDRFKFQTVIYDHGKDAGRQTYLICCRCGSING